MRTVEFPYGKGHLSHSFTEQELVGVLTAPIHDYDPGCAQEALIAQAMAAPIGSPTLAEMARGKNKVVIIASDHTRPVPSKLILPPMLSQIRQGNPNADITILIATGCHRATTRQELLDKFGQQILDNEKIYIHDCDETEKLRNIGKLPSGGDCVINTIALDADLLVAEGFIEPHFFAGFSGGRKSVLPGIAGRQTVLANHCSEFIADPHARTGILENNPIHRDMVWAAQKAGLAYIVNVVLNAHKQVIHAVAGDPVAAHAAGTAFLLQQCGAPAVNADVAISTNGGYPLDQNVYQAVKGMTAAEATVKPGGVIIMLADSGDGIGGDHFYHQLSDEPDIRKTMELFLSRGRGETPPDQWQTQILLRILMHANVIYISTMPDDVVKQMHMHPAHSIAEALDMARTMLGKEDITIAAIPDGVSVMVTK